MLQRLVYPLPCVLQRLPARVLHVLLGEDLTHELYVVNLAVLVAVKEDEEIDGLASTSEPT